MKRRSQRWKELERTAARKLRGKRIVRQDFFESSPDVEVPDFGMLAECKAYKAFSFHRHMEQSAKYCKPGEVPILVTKSANQIGEFATLPLDRLAALLDEIRAFRKARDPQRGGPVHISEVLPGVLAAIERDSRL